MMYLPRMLLVVVCAGCAAPARVEHRTPAASQCAGAPMTARWTSVTKHPHPAGTRLVLDGVVEVPGVAPGTLVATVVPPEGAVALTPTTVALGTVAPGAQVPLRVELAYAATPGKDLSVELDARDGDAFAHVSLAWRFGRPPPAPPPLRLDGPHVVLFGRDLGPSLADGLVATGAR